MPFGKGYHPRIAERQRRDKASASRSGGGRNLVHAADHNDRVTLEALRRGEALTRQDLAAVTGLSAPGISNIMHRLVDAGLVRMIAGARPARFELAPDAALAMGIDIEGDLLSAVLVDLKGQVRMRERRRAESAEAAAVAEAARALAFALAGRLPPAVSDRLIGIGVAGAPDPEQIRKALTPFATIVESDAACAVLGERLLGHAPADGTFVHLLFGRSVRAGLMIGGSLFDGATHRAGRIGQMRTGDDGRLLDQAASLAELAPILSAHFDQGGAPEAFLPGLDADAAAVVEGWLDRSTAHVLDAIIAISGFIAPSAIFVGGRLPGDLIERFTDRLSTAETARMTKPMQPQWLPRILPATLRSDCVVLGAAMLPFLEFLLPDPRRSPETRAGREDAED